MTVPFVYGAASRQFVLQPELIFVRFEQGRGRGGVPKTWLPFFLQEGAPPQVTTLVRQAVELFRAQCSDPHTHGRDLMPGASWEEYELHNIDGGAITTPEEIKWETVNGIRRAECVLTWGNPAERLIAEVTK